MGLDGALEGLRRGEAAGRARRRAGRGGEAGQGGGAGRGCQAGRFGRARRGCGGAGRWPGKARLRRAGRFGRARRGCGGPGAGGAGMAHPPLPVISPPPFRRKKELLTGSPFNNNIGWGPEFKVWHDRYIGPSHRPLVTASSISILTGFLEMKDYWTVMPVTTARGLMKTLPSASWRWTRPRPSGTLYLLTHQSPTTASAQNTELFCEYLKEYLAKL